MGHILIVDDKEDNRYLLRALLQGSGFTVDEAVHGEEAMLKAEQTPPDLIISDLLMPVVDGYTLLKQWKADERFRSIPFMVYTATYTDERDARLALNLGADAFLLKPAEPDDFLLNIRDVMSRGKAGETPKTHAPLSDENLLLKQYNDVLVRKLEQKVKLLEESNRALNEEIADHQRARAELQHATNLLTAVTDGTSDAVFVKDGAGRYLFCNPAGARFMGREASEIMGRSDAEFFDAASALTIRDNDARVMAQDSVETTEETLTAAGNTRTYHTTKAPYRDADGRCIGVIGISRDITERKRLEEHLHHAQRMESIGRLAGGVAHDFNNLLSVIMGYSEMALETLPADSEEHEQIAQVRFAADRAVALTRQLLAFSRKQVLQPVVLDLNQAIADSRMMLQRLIGDDITLDFNAGPLLGHVKADPGQIEQVILNLAVNARDAMPAGGRISIKTSNLTLDDSYLLPQTSVAPGAYVLFTVTDTGCGMDAETISRIFEPFFTTKAEGKGTGLGLATVYGIVQQSGGYISVYSEVGQGTTFKILLPRIQEELGEAKSTRPSAPMRGTECILLVEDDAALRQLTAKVLQANGYTVLSTANGAEALDVAAGHKGRVDLLLTDVVMPQIGGRELANQLAGHRPDMKVLYMSGFTDDAIVRHGISHDTIAFIGKPFTALQLTRRIRETIDGA